MIRHRREVWASDPSPRHVRGKLSHHVWLIAHAGSSAPTLAVPPENQVPVEPLAPQSAAASRPSRQIASLIGIFTLVLSHPAGATEPDSHEAHQTEGADGLSGRAHPVTQDVQVKQIEAVIEAFRTSIITKDKARFVELFLHDKVTWQSVEGDESLRLMRQNRPEAEKLRLDANKNHLSFIHRIVTDPARREEKFWNVDIRTDGDIASVFFDYSFHTDDRETNRGKEAWHLVNTGESWKIASVIYSVHRKP